MFMPISIEGTNDNTYLRSHVRGEFFYLYLIEDVWSRKIYKARKDLLVQVTQLLVKTSVARAEAVPSLDRGYAPALAERVVQFLERPWAPSL